MVIVRPPMFRVMRTGVENYQRTSKSIEEEPQKPPAENEIKISHNKISVYVDIGLKKFQEEQKKHIILVGKGQHVNKTVTVVEMIKRKMQGTLHQYTQLGSVSVTEQWDSKEDKELDSIQVKKKIPVIIIHLSIDEMPELNETSGYQAPTGPDIYE
ncbi:hypothetical protein G6F70_006022 [Rhizopus microsporus]|nr:hypothetical protein G6F71_000932 [Rhizopus microsporus]KAG1198184.1 hypothetical protein G6F70_006022 [Rhizopus microsporus]KAG1215354.1 hypothetical protein G6F69_001103 [Rhizopus microsporus]KAG1238679.1 hypothetical protein G6F67_000264 [Rhizopus microsporus]KAG1269081.1 hypothetical protein G6F68_000573 [Rhizopus microsporus]